MIEMATIVISQTTYRGVSKGGQGGRGPPVKFLPPPQKKVQDKAASTTCQNFLLKL